MRLYLFPCKCLCVCVCVWQCTIRRNNKTQLLQIVKLNISHKQQQRQQHNGTAAAAAASHNNNNSRSWPNWNCKCPWHDYRYFLCVCCMHSCVTRGGVCVSIDYRSCLLILRLTHTHTHTCVTLHMSNKKGVDFYALLFLFSWAFFYSPRTCELLVLLIVSLIIFSRTLLAAAAAAAGCSVDKAQPQPRIVGGDNGGWGVRFYTHTHTHTHTQTNVFIVQVQRRLSLWESSMLRSCWCPQRYRQRQLETALHIPHASGWSVLCCCSVLFCFGGAFIISVSINVEQSLPLLATFPDLQFKLRTSPIAQTKSEYNNRKNKCVSHRISDGIINRSSLSQAKVE